MKSNANFVAGLLCMGAVVASSAWAQVQDASKVPEVYVQAYRDGNADRIAALFASDATFIPLLGMPRFEGRDPVRAYYAKSIAATKSRNITPVNEKVQYYGDIIVRTADIRIDQEFTDGSTRATQARVTFVYRRAADGWWIVHHHQSVQPPAPVPPPATTAR